MKVKELLEELKFYDRNMEVYIEFDGKDEVLSCSVEKVRLSKGYPVLFLFRNERILSEIFKEIGDE